MPVSTYTPEGPSNIPVPGALDSDDIFRNFGLDDLGLSVSENGSLTISDPASFIARLGLKNYTPENFRSSNFAGFKDIDSFVKFLSDAHEAGNTDKPDSLYKMLLDPESNLQKEFSKKVSTAKADEVSRQQANKALGIKEEPKKEEFKELDGKLFSVPGEVEAKSKIGAAPAAEQGNFKANLDNPAGLLAMAKNQGPINPKDKSLDAFQRGNIQKALNAQAARQIDDDIAKKRRSDRIQKIIDDREADLKESWARSRTGRMDGRSWDQLDEETKSEMRGRFMDARANSAYTDEKYKKLKGFTFDEEGNPTNAPIFDRDGLVGFKTLPQMEKEMGGESIKVAKVDPRTEAQKRETRILDEIDQEIKETGQHPFGEDPVLGTNYRQEVKNREKYGPGYKQLKDQSIDLFNNPEVQKSIPSAPSIPMAPTAKPSMPASYNRSIVSPEMLAKNSQDVSDVLDSVPMPAMPKRSLGPIKSSPYNYTHRRTLEYPTEPSQSGLVNSTKEYPTFSLETPAEPGPELTRTTKEYPTEPTQQSLVERTLEYPVTTPEGAQQRKQTSGFGRSGKKQFNIPALDFLDLTNYTYNEPSYEQTQLPGFGRSGKKQFNLKFLDRLDPRNYSYKQ